MFYLPLIASMFWWILIIGFGNFNFISILIQASYLKEELDI